MPKTPQNYYVYIIQGNDGTFYTGITNNVEERLLKHNGQKTGGAKYTKTRRPWKIIYTEKHKTRSDALKKECEIKKMSRLQKNKLIIKN
jgi:putative endonuclease